MASLFNQYLCFMEKKFIQLNDIDAYKIAFNLSNEIWNIVMLWDYFAKDTVGKQFVRSADSISANIAEGFGRYHKNDKTRFYRISFGSLKETFDWLEKSKVRKLITQKQYNELFSKLNELPRYINQLIQYTNQKLKI